jgi:hypothetical protein
VVCMYVCSFNNDSDQWIVAVRRWLIRLCEWHVRKYYYVKTPVIDVVIMEARS